MYGMLHLEICTFRHPLLVAIATQCPGRAKLHGYTKRDGRLSSDSVCVCVNFAICSYVNLH